jgi:hypothetical protein
MMEDPRKPNNERDFSEDIIRQLRESALSEEQAPSGESDHWRPKELSLNLASWLVRGLIIILVLVFIGEVYLLTRIQPEENHPLAQFQGGPEHRVIPAPVVRAPQDAPPVAGAGIPTATTEEIEHPVPPTLSPPPLPPELLDVEIPPPDV